MTKLKCTVQNCAYNEKLLCCRGDIRVEGPRAERAADTVCASFAPKGYGVLNGPVHHGTQAVRIRCLAEHCAHCRGETCEADSVCVDGSGAKNVCDTKCATFLKKR